jgi:hypothetical protein
VLPAKGKTKYASKQNLKSSHHTVTKSQIISPFIPLYIQHIKYHSIHRNYKPTYLQTKTGLKKWRMKANESK